MKLDYQMKGFKELEKKLKKLKKPKAKSIWRKGVRAASSVLLKVARPKTTTESKTLRKSLAVRIKARRRDGAMVGIVGPRQRFEKIWKGKIRKPSKYAHLVEKGRRTKVRFSLRRGPYMIRGVKAKSFLGYAIRSAGKNAYKAMGDKIAEELKKI